MGCDMLNIIYEKSGIQYQKNNSDSTFMQVPVIEKTHIIIFLYFIHCVYPNKVQNILPAN